jgi:two-component system response regulator PilR (NtrC family)
MQSKLLRAIQERCVRPVGATQEEAVDVRIISATHKDLGAEVQAGRFRQDLYYRLNVIEIDIPPLRERREDLSSLCEALLQRIAAESGAPVATLSAAALQQLEQLSLMGNVRELENLLHRAVALNEGGELQLDLSRRTAPSALAPDATQAAPPAVSPTAIPSDLQHHLDQQERNILIHVLRETGFNRTAAAARLGLSLRQIRYRIARLNIDAPQDHDTPEAS